MKYEIDMMTGKKDRPVFEVGALLLHKETNRKCKIIKKELFPDSPWCYKYTLMDEEKDQFTARRTMLLMDFKYIGDQING